MIIHKYRPDYLMTIENEFEVWHDTAILPTRGSSIYSLAMYAARFKIPMKVVVGSHEYKFPGYKFKSYTKKEIGIARFASDLTYKKAKNAGVDIEEREFNFDEVKKQLTSGKILLLRLLIGIVRQTKENKRNPHYLAVYGCADGTFKVMDPKHGPIEVKEEVMKEAFEKVGDAKRDHRMIVFG